jgi:hypothetical protein
VLSTADKFRRYSDFDKFHELLALQRSDLTTLPPKLLFTQECTDLAQRMLELDAYLRALLASPAVALSPLLCTFLDAVDAQTFKLQTLPRAAAKASSLASAISAAAISETVTTTVLYATVSITLADAVISATTSADRAANVCPPPPSPTAPSHHTCMHAYIRGQATRTGNSHRWARDRPQAPLKR